MSSSQSTVIDSTAYTSPFAISVWLAAATVLNYLLGFQPNDISTLSYFAPLIGFGLSALPALALIEYLHRGPFTARMRKVLGAEDMVDPVRYYGEDLKVLQHNGEVVGVLALDTTANAAKQLESVLGEEEGQQGEQLVAPVVEKGKAKVIHIRHLDVDFASRKAGVAKELLLAGLDHSFAANPEITSAVVLASPFTPGGDAIWQSLGFRKVERQPNWATPKSMGVLSWREEWWAITSSEWSKSRARIINGHR